MISCFVSVTTTKDSLLKPYPSLIESNDMGKEAKENEPVLPSSSHTDDTQCRLGVYWERGVLYQLSIHADDSLTATMKAL